MAMSGERVAKREARVREWRAHFARRARSGQTVAAYCAEQGLRPWQYWYWRKARLRTRPKSGFVELTARAGSGVTLVLGGCRIGLERGFDPVLLRDVVTALRAG